MDLNNSKVYCFSETLPSNNLVSLTIGNTFIVHKYVSSVLYRMHIFCNYYMLFNVVD